MAYSVRVTGPGKETKYDEFKTDDAEKLDEVEADARSAYASAVREYDMFHTVTLFRDGVSVGNATGVGSGELDDAPDPEEEEVPRTEVVEDAGSLLKTREVSAPKSEPRDAFDRPVPNDEV